MKRPLLVAMSACLLAGCAQPEAESGNGEASPSTEEASAVSVVAEGVVSTSESVTFPAEDPATGDLWFSVIGESFDQQTIRVSRRTASGYASSETAPFSGRR